MRKYRSLLLVLPVAVLLSACGGLILSPVSEADRDLSGQYDARWTAEIDHPGGRQQLSRGWYVDCGALNNSMNFEVKDGILLSSWGSEGEVKSYETFVDADGRFRLEVRSSEKLRLGRGVASDDRMTLILQGSLAEEESNGRFVYAVRQFQDRGCTYPVKFERVG